MKPKSFFSANSRNFFLIVFLIFGFSGAQLVAAPSFFIIDLGTLGGTYSAGHGINNSGVVICDGETNNHRDHAFIHRNGTNGDLSSMTFGPLFSIGNGINNSNQCVGQILVNGGADHAFVASDTNRTDLGTIGGDYSNAYGINDAGNVVGETTVSRNELYFDWHVAIKKVP